LPGLIPDSEIRMARTTVKTVPKTVAKTAAGYG
jgi:hypothetical protein